MIHIPAHGDPDDHEKFKEFDTATDLFHWNDELTTMCLQRSKKCNTPWISACVLCASFCLRRFPHFGCKEIGAVVVETVDLSDTNSDKEEEDSSVVADSNEEEEEDDDSSSNAGDDHEVSQSLYPVDSEGTISNAEVVGGGVKSMLYYHPQEEHEIRAGDASNAVVSSVSTATFHGTPHNLQALSIEPVPSTL
ncbi:hypothetical protein HID58_038505 [Brassica napus]|uniref:Uncharacterized protein n=1 Tax=Brassica napus TaxID=3708 RepID=A0ABQ8BPN5_BRANA|nr:hypothetical protein HID58_038505 [Brassica napus]